MRPMFDSLYEEVVSLTFIFPNLICQSEVLCCGGSRRIILSRTQNPFCLWDDEIGACSEKWEIVKSSYYTIKRNWEVFVIEAYKIWSLVQRSEDYVSSVWHKKRSYFILFLIGSI